MGRSRVLSFVSQFSGNRESRVYPGSSSSASPASSSTSPPTDSAGHIKQSSSSSKVYSTTADPPPPGSSLQQYPTSQSNPQRPFAVAAANAAVSYYSASPQASNSSAATSSSSQFAQGRQQQQQQRQKRQSQQPPQGHSNQLGPRFEGSREYYAENPIAAREATFSPPGAEITASPEAATPPSPQKKAWQEQGDRRFRDEQRRSLDQEKGSTAPLSAPRSRAQSTYVSHNHSPSRHQSRPLSMVQTYQPPLMDVSEDTIPELLPIFTFLNGHANKLYQEGYFLKLDDQNIHGHPNPDRTWVECFAQLVGTVLSLWDAAQLDAAGEEGEVLPKFINLTDASIQMIESLPTKSGSPNDQPLQNILSISTAGRNRYLLHFNSHHSLLQWTAGIRLSMYEQATLQEAYTGALIAGKGKSLNNINIIMERTRHRVEEWVRVRFGAGTPWRRCWCVISPPDEKEYQKAQKEWKKRSPYDRSGPPVLKGDIKFFDTKLSPKKQKKVKPLATITDSYSAYAIYPQAKSLIEASTLLKIEGNVTYYLDPPSSKEGFVFVMPEVPPAVGGFEMLLRFLFPTWDTFALYGRPGRLVASVLDQRSLMFAMPRHKKYGYLEVLDVTGLILTEGSISWSEREWRRRMKELTSHRMTAMDDASSSKTHSRSGSRRSNRLSMGPAGASGLMRPRVNFADDVGSVRSGRSMTVSQGAPRTDSAPPINRDRAHGHARNSSDPYGAPMAQSPLGYAADFSPSHSPARAGTPSRGARNDLTSTPEGQSSEEDLPRRGTPVRELEENVRNLGTPEPVTAPPAFAHTSAARPSGKAYHSPELRKANTRLSHTTLTHIMTPVTGPSPVFPERLDENKRWESDDSPVSSSGYSDRRAQVVHTLANPDGIMANSNGSREGLSPRSQSGAARPRSPLAQSNVTSPEEGGAHVPAQALSTDSQSFNSSPGSRSNSIGSQAHPQVFCPPFAPPVPSAAKPALVAVDKSQEIQRKPVPTETATPKSPGNGDVPHSETSASSFADLVIDPAALDQVHMPDLEPNREALSQGILRHATQESGAGSNCDDASTASPDYASTIQSDETAESVERPRAGALRTVGDVNHETVTANSSIPDINFGPTLDLTRPFTSHTKSHSQSSVGQDSLRPYSPDQKTPPGRKTPSGEFGHIRQASDDTVRRIPWHAGAAAPGMGSAGKTLSPGEYVQQRAAHVPMHQHHRQLSGNIINVPRTGTPTPPLNRAVTYDPGTKPIHSRSSSTDLLQRPSSRGVTSSLNVGSGLSAREQEQVARMTGSSLIQVDGRRPEPQSAGLVGAIAQRERERQQMKQGFSNQAVQQAIHQRQQAQAQQVYQQQMKQQHPYQQQHQPNPMYGVFSTSSPSVYSGGLHQSQPRQTFGVAPTHTAAQAFTQGGNWSRPNMAQMPSSQGVSSQGYASSGQLAQGGRGNFSGQQFQGQAF